MNLRNRLPWWAAVFGVASSAFACGPFFPETVLDQSRATLRTPIVNFEAEVRQLAPPSPSPDFARPTAKLSDDSPGSWRSLDGKIIGPEVEELESVLSGLPEDRRAKVISEYRALRSAMLLKYWTEHFATYDLNVPPDGWMLLAEAQRGHWPKDLPPDIALYLEGALDYDYGSFDKAIATWNRLLELPSDQRRNRSVAAAWMIAKTIRETDGLAAAQPWYATCAKLSGEGFRDSLKLGIASLGWEARQALAQDDLRKALELYYHQAMAGDQSGWNSLLRALPDPTKMSDTELTDWAKDPFLRGLLTARLLRSSFFWNDYYREDSDEDFGVARWLAAIERANLENLGEASKFAELAYSSGDFDAARRWLKRAPANDPRALWVRGKLALMDGDTKTAEKSFLAARPGFPRATDSSDMSVMMDRAGSALPAQTAVNYRTSQFYGDLGAASLARDHYTQALGAFCKGAFYADAGYVAERVLGPEELLAYVRRNFPGQTGKLGEESYWGPGAAASSRIRYLLARRLARIRYFKDARPFYPDELVPVFDRYVELIRKSRSSVPRKERAAALWEAAQIHRMLGMELFGTYGQPDGESVDGMFPMDPVIRRRTGLEFARKSDDSWFSEEERPDLVPAPTVDERARVRQSKMPCEERYQYRYAAADLAWKAALLMPDKSEETARVLGIAGRWLAVRDPDAADRFYKAMIWRNWSTPLAREADERRWFPDIAWDYNPWTAAGTRAPDGY